MSTKFYKYKGSHKDLPQSSKRVAEPYHPQDTLNYCADKSYPIPPPKPEKQFWEDRHKFLGIGDSIRRRPRYVKASHDNKQVARKKS